MFLSITRNCIFAGLMASAALACGCVGGDGAAAGHVDFDLEAAIHVEASALRDGRYVTDANEEIELESLKLHLSEIRLISRTASGGNGAVFDPSNPPDPYENCHANHCHIKGSSDTKSFAEIEAELSGGAVTSRDVLVLSPGTDLEFTALTQTFALESFAGGDLPYGEINEVELTFDTYSLAARNVTTGAGIRLTNEHAHDGVTHVEPLILSHATDIDIDASADSNDHDIRLVIAIDAALLDEVSADDVDFADLMAEHAELELEGHDHDHTH